MSIRAAALRRWRAALAAAALACVGQAVADPAPTPSPADKALKQTQLQGVEDTLKASETQRRKIEADVEAIKIDRARFSGALIETTATVQQTASDRIAATARFVALSGEADKLAASLEARRGVIADVLAALQRMGRNPPPAILVRPADMAEAVRAAMVLGATLPGLKAETEALAHDLDKLASLRTDMSRQRDELARTAKSLAEERQRLGQLIAARQQSLDVAENALAAERKRFADLAAQASNMRDLIARMEGRNPDGDVAAAADIASRAAALRGADPARLKPAVAFVEAKGQLPLPVAGAILKTFGDPDSYGGEEKGVSIAAPPSATVATPIDGWVVFAGPYRTYGQLLILKAGDGYYMVLAGMDRISVTVGPFVLAGEPIAAMGDGSARTAAAAAIGAAQPVLYIELRKNETAIDPGPWWAKNNIEKARG